MVDEPTSHSSSRLTARGAATRARIINAAAELMHVKGVEATTLGEILIASTASKSQFRQHFADKDDLICEVIGFRADEVLATQTRQLGKVDSFRGLEQWRDALLQRNALRRGAWGCVLGSLSSELSDHDDRARRCLSNAFENWERLLAAAFVRMRDKGVLSDDIDPVAIATSVMSAVQGGYLLAQLARDSAPMRLALDMALGHVRSFQPLRPT